MIKKLAVSTSSETLSDEVDLGILETDRDDIAEAEVLVKSSDRVRDLGEVFTPAATVNAMLDQLPLDVWRPHPSMTFFEPGCGDGNFLVAILQRKLAAITQAAETDSLAAGVGFVAEAFHGLEALASIYAVDISPDNVIGGTPGHELGARQRMLDLFSDWAPISIGEDRIDPLRRAAEWIVERNVTVGNLLPELVDGTPTGRENLPLVEYQWEPGTAGVTMYEVTLGEVMENARADLTGVKSLFSDKPEPTWSGHAFEIFHAQVPLTPVPNGPVRNGHVRKTS